MKKKTKIKLKINKSKFQQMIPLSKNTLKVSLVFLKKWIKLMQSTLYGDFIDLSFNMTMPTNGCEQRSEPHWDTQPKNPMLGWTDNNQQLD